MSLTLDDTSFAKYFKKIGRKEATRENAKKMLLEGIILNIVTKVTGLSKEEVTKLKETK